MDYLISPEQWKKLMDFIQNYFLTRPCTILAIGLFIISFVFTVQSIKYKSKNKQIAALICYIGVVYYIFRLFNRDVGANRELRLYFDPWLLEKWCGIP